MYWWNVRGLAEDLIAQRVTSKEEYMYLLWWVIGVCPAFLFIAPRDQFSFGLIPLLRSLASVLIILGGMGACRDANTRGDAQDFVRRVICLGWPIGVRLFLTVLLPGKVLLISLEKNWGYSLGMYFEPIVQAVYFWRLCHWVRAVSTRKLE